MSKVYKIAVLGPECSGKSTICKQLASHYKTSFVPEYARFYLSNKPIGYTYNIEDIININKNQILSEEKKRTIANNFLFCDTSPLVNKIWALEKFGHCPIQISQSVAQEKYDLYLLTKPDFDWEFDVLRENKQDTMRLFNIYSKELLYLNKQPLLVLHGSKEKRFKFITHYLDTFFNKY